MSNKETQEETRYTLRLPTEFYEWIQGAAKAQRCSVNSLIVLLIQQAKEKDEKERANQHE